MIGWHTGENAYYVIANNNTSQYYLYLGDNLIYIKSYIHL
ncbi:hypothetical protein yinte0001_2280 [Yersinia intermedia ATCC 29909]|nr:hypothetical protein yinte0001_2280 [Yersinia intermedia ATCC 29909]